MSRFNKYTIAANSNIFLGDNIRAADMCLLACGDTDVAPRRTDRTETLALGGAIFAQIVRRFTATDGEADPARPHQPALFRLFKAP